MRTATLTLLAATLPVASVLAAALELGTDGSFRRTNLDKTNYTDNKSISGSISYYFMELSALELSYTKGLTTIKTQTIPASISDQTTKTEYELLGVDFILSYGGRESAFRPYIKLGSVHVKREILVQNTFTTTPTIIKPEDGWAPSAGIGVKLLITQYFAIKLGFDAWTSPSGQKPVEYSYAGKAGISWLFF